MRICTSLVLTLSLFASSPAFSEPPVASFEGLGDLAGGDFNSFAFDVSDDGSVVVGSGFSSNGGEAFRWTRAHGMIGLGDLPGGLFESSASGVSSNGSVVAGTGLGATNPRTAFRWTSPENMLSLSDFSSYATDVSDDGDIVVGYQLSSGYEAYYWNAREGAVGLGAPAGSAESFAMGLSGNGSTIVGYSSSSNNYEAFLWTDAEGFVELGDLVGGTNYSTANAASWDGSVIVGGGSSASGAEAFRWTSGEGMVGLGDLPGGLFNSQAIAVSADGSTIVGESNSTVGYEAFIWDQENGMRSLQTLLSERGLNLDGWTLRRANGISADGSTIVGYGINPAGNNEAWIAVIPEPNFGILASCCLVLVTKKRKEFRN